MGLEEEDRRYEALRKKKELEKATKLVKGSLGEDAEKILEDHGIDVNSAISNILSEKIERERTAARAFLQTPREETSLTSELVYLMRGKDAYRSELQRRLDLLNLSAMQRAAYIKSDLEALDTRKFKPPEEERWTTKIYLMQGTKKEDLLKPEECTLSETVSIVDDANAAWWRDHHWLGDDTMKAVGYVLTGEKGKSPYFNEFLSRVNNWDLKEPQWGSYIKNDCMLLECWKWNYNENPAWQESTMLKGKS